MKLTCSKKTNATDRCCFCGDHVNLDDEGVQYGNGKCAHDHCDDANEYNSANEADFRD